MLSTRSLYSGGTFYFSERKQDNFFLVKIFICEGLKPPLDSFSQIDHAVIVMSNNY